VAQPSPHPYAYEGLGEISLVVKVDALLEQQ